MRLPTIWSFGLAALAVCPMFAGGKDIRVGCYYFPGWFCADRWVPVAEFEQGKRQPLIGYYRDDSPEVQDWHIRHATQHGISFWVFDLYYDYDKGAVAAHDAALDQGFLKASLCRQMDFALMWCNETPTTYTEAKMLHLVRVLGERYFSQPNYLKVAPRQCFLVVSDPWAIVRQWGAEKTNRVLKTMKTAAARYGGLWLVAKSNQPARDGRELLQAGFDACTAYCYSAEGMPDPSKPDAPYDTMLPVVEKLWRDGRASKSLKMIPTVSPGWDSRPWWFERALCRKGSTPEKFGQMCRSVLPYVDDDLRLVLVGTWNEFGEGSHMEPTHQWGFGYLDALQQAFFPTAASHEHQLPSESQRQRMNFADVPAFLGQQTERHQGNLVRNPGFERDWGWVYYDETPVALDYQTVHSGCRSVAISASQQGIKPRILQPGVPWPNRPVNLIPLEPGRRYIVSAWVNGRAAITCALFDKNRKFLSAYRPIQTGGSDGKWERLSGELAGDDPSVSWFGVEICTRNGRIYVDDVEVLRK